VAELAFTDTHVHFHDFAEPSLRWDWLKPDVEPDVNLGEFGAIRSRCYRAEDFLAETRFHNVAAVVHMQAAIGSPDPVAETAWLDAIPARLDVPQAAIGHADLAAPDIATTLARKRRFRSYGGSGIFATTSSRTRAGEPDSPYSPNTGSASARIRRSRTCHGSQPLPRRLPPSRSASIMRVSRSGATRITSDAGARAWRLSPTSSTRW
jgi:hypothetical protein